MDPEESGKSKQPDEEKPRWSVSSGAGLHYGSFGNSLAALTPAEEGKTVITTKKAYITVAVLCYVNLINYMERFSIAGVLSNVQAFFNINDSMAALLQTVFICSFLLLAPVFGYLGDRYNRKYIMIFGVIVWLATAVASSFVTKSHFWLLLLLRAIVGVGEASYSTIAPTIIGDLFTDKQRSTMICAFYIFMPVGSGLGYVTGAGVASLAGDWRWALRVSPILGVVGLALLIGVCPNPPRGAAETQGHGVTKDSTYLEDIRYLLQNKSYLWSTLGVTATTFNVGALAFWAPTFLSRAQIFQGIQEPCVQEPCSQTDSYIFGAVTVVTGILGGTLGTFLSRRLRVKWPHVDPIICAVGLLGSVPGLLIAFFVAAENIPVTYVFIFISEVLIALNWAVMADILLYVCMPTRRSTAEAIQISMAHLLGDAGSPYLVGVISDAIRHSKVDNAEWNFRSLMYSFLVCVFVGLLGGLFFLMTSRYVIADRAAVVKSLKESSTEQQQGEPGTETSIELDTQKKTRL
ncbi:uncharacterized protein V6R79_008877 [Siganus canaliculatus]